MTEEIKNLEPQEEGQEQQEQEVKIEPTFHVAPSPHQFDTSVTTKKVMLDVLIGLVPIVVWSLYVFRIYAFKQIVTAVIACTVFETLFARMRNKPSTLGDLSAVITGVILALSLPATTPLFITVIASGIAIGIGKAVFGGLGYNMFNPAMVGRAFVMLSFARWLGAPAYVDASLGIDALSRPTPLSAAKDFMKLVFENGESFKAMTDIKINSLFMGTTNGSLGEVSILFILIGGLYLIFRKAAAWQIPAGSVIGFTVLAWIFYALELTPFSPIHQLFSGAFFFGAFFIATDPVSSPLSRKGRFYFGMGFGCLAMILRVFSSYPEGVMFAILIMNALVPLINRYTVPVPLGGGPRQSGPEIQEV